ncbi:MAG: tandem-95 repeat protein [Sagittula sp.]|uniref:tandem-95 repeat protein n=1 Tax=Sagittula sp. TaxID=2038081 RepID=UPI00405A26A6
MPATIELINATSGTTTYATLQEAVDAAASGDTIEITGGGVLTEQVIIEGKDLTINGNGVTIEMPSPPTLTLLADTHGGSRDRAAVITVIDGDVDITGVTVDGAGLGNDMPGTASTSATRAPDYEGILYVNAEGTMDGVTVTGVRDAYVGGQVSGNQRGVAVVVLNTDGTPRSVTFQNGTVEDFQKNGFVGDGEGLTFSVLDSTVTGGGFLVGSGAQAQNGIQVSGGAVGIIDGNTVEEIGYTRGDWSTSGVLAYAAGDGTVITNNTFTGATSGGSQMATTHIPIYVYGETDNAVVTGNNFDHTVFGVVFSNNTDDPTVSGNTWTNQYESVTETTNNAVWTASQYEIYAEANDSALNVTLADGDDYVVGTDFADTVDLGGGNDYAEGGLGADTLSGGQGLDTLLGGDGDDVLDGEENPDSIEGGAGDDHLIGGGNTDVLNGGADNDLIEGGIGADSIDGGTGNDTIIAQGYDSIDGGAGTDVLEISEFAGMDAAALAPLMAAPDVSGLQGVMAAQGITLTSASVTGGVLSYEAFLTSDPTGTQSVTGVEVLKVAGSGGDTFLVFEGMSIAAAIAAADEGDTILLGAGTFSLTGELTISKGITLAGAGEGVTILDRDGSGYGIHVTTDDVTLSDFTLDASGLTTPGGYGIKVSPGGSATSLSGFTAQDVTVFGAARSEIDLNGVDDSSLIRVTADGGSGGSAGVGIAMSDSTGILLEDITTLNNNWGSVGLYSAGRSYEAGTSGITFAGSYSSNEVIGIYADEEVDSGSGQRTVVEDIDFSGIYSEVFKVQNPDWRNGGDGRGEDFTFFFGSLEDAEAFAFSLTDNNGTDVSGSSVISMAGTASDVDAEGGDTWYVYDGMSIQAIIDLASAGDTIVVNAGTYEENLTLGKQLTLVGPQAGVGGTDGARGAEAVIAGSVSFNGGSDGSTLDGFRVEDGALTGSSLVYVGVDGITVTNSVLDGDYPTDSGTRGILTAGTADDLTVSDNLITEVRSGIYFNVGTGAVVTGNSFVANGNGINADGPQMTDISGNIFDGSAGAQIALGATEDPSDFGGFIGANTFLPEGTGVSIYPLSSLPDGAEVLGTENADSFRGDIVANWVNPNEQYFDGRGGNDSIRTGAGDDTALGGEGNDYIDGGAGNDSLSGGEGDDTIVVGAGTDVMDGCAGTDLVDASAQTGAVSIDLAANQLSFIVPGTGLAAGTGAGLNGLTGFENMAGGSAADQLLGDGGDNVIFVSAGDDQIDGRAGTDTYDLSADDGGVTVDLAAGTSAKSIGGNDSIAGIENVITGDGDDDVTGDASANLLETGDGADTVDGGEGSDSIDGGMGDDELTGGAGDDSITGGAGTDTAVIGDDFAGATFAQDGTSVTVVSADGTDVLTGVELLEFDDVTVGAILGDDGNATDEDTAVTGNVLANDFDLDFEGLTVIEGNGQALSGGTLTFTTANGASVTLNDDGSYSYDPSGAFDALNEGEAGTDSFTYTVEEDDGTTATATVTIDLTGVNDAPVMVDGNGAADEDGAAIVVDLSALGSDADAENDGSDLTYTITTAPGAGEGSAEITGSSLTYDPGSDFQGLAAGEEAFVTIGVTATDAQTATSNEGTITITVTGTNDDPTLTAGAFSVSEDSGATSFDLSGLADDIDSDNDGADLTYSVVSGPGVIVNGTELSFDTAGGYEYLDDGETEEVTIRVQVEDAHGATAEADMVVTVTGVNDAPESGPTTADVVEANGATATVDAATLLSEATDVDGDTLSVVAASVTQDTGSSDRDLGGAFTVGADGAISFDLDLFDDLDENDVETLTFTYDITDGDETVSTSVVVTVTGTNDDPVVTAQTENDTPDIGEDAGLTTVVDLATITTDVDGNDLPADLTYTLDPGYTGGGVFSLDGTVLEFDPNGDFDALDVDDEGFVTIAVTATDAQGGSHTANISLRVTGENDAPEFTGIGDASPPIVPEDGPGFLIVDLADITTDADGDDLPADLTYSFDAGYAGGGTFSLVGTELWFDPDGDFEYLDDPFDREEVTIGVTVEDAQGGSNSVDITFEVAGAEDDPVLAGIVGIAASVSEDASGATTVADLAALATDADADAVLSFSLGSYAGPGSFALDGTDLTFDPAGGFEYLADGETAQASIEVTVTDAEGNSDTATYTVEITGADDPVLVSGPVSESVSEDDGTVTIDAAALLANASTADTSDELSIQNLVRTDGGRAIPGITISDTGGISFDAGAFNDLADGESEVLTFTYDVSDGVGAPVSSSVSVTVNGANDAPAIFDLGSFINSDNNWTTTASETSITEDTATGYSGNAIVVFEDVDTTDTASVSVSFSLSGDAAELATPTQLMLLESALQPTGATSGLHSGGLLNVPFSFGLSNAVLGFLSAGDTAVGTWTVTVSDGLATDSYDFVVDLIGANDPVTAVDDAVTVDEDESIDLTALVLGNDTDLDPADVLSVSAINTTGTAGTVSLVGGVLTYDANGAFDYLEAGETATDTFTYTVSDGNGGTDTATVTVTVDGKTSTINGTEGADSLTGTEGNDIMNGLAGDDTLLGGSGDDTMDGGDGKDLMRGQNGNDQINGGDQTDIIYGGNQDDVLYGNGGDDFVFGQAGNDSMWGGDGHDVLNGINGDDEMFGEAGNDSLYGGGGDDMLNGGDGDDTLDGQWRNDVLTGGAGADCFKFTTAGDMDTITDFEDGIDVLDFSADGLGFADFTVAEYGGGAGTVLTGGGYTVFLEGVDTIDIDTGDFV